MSLVTVIYKHIFKIEIMLFSDFNKIFICIGGGGGGVGDSTNMKATLCVSRNVYVLCGLFLFVLTSASYEMLFEIFLVKFCFPDIFVFLISGVSVFSIQLQ